MPADAPSGIIRLGLIATAMAARPLAAGPPVIGFDIDATRCNTFKADGVELAVSPGELA
jgi:3-hydroxyisobutyrate dehydrogenase-like beta-hydroxyacid dehydrogenase